MSVDWDYRYRIGRHGWDKGQAAPPLVEWLRRHRPSGRILVPGCGRGHDAAALAGPQAEVLGVDISATAVRAAQARYGRPGLRFALCDALHSPAARLGRFDWVVEHTCFCAIPPRERPAYVRRMAELLRPGGHLLGIFFLEPHVVTGPPFGVQPAELDRLFEPCFELVARWLPTEKFPEREDGEEVRLYRRCKFVRVGGAAVPS
ncbi:MAG: methyltransferase domain-containing protein [Verrucomicrobiota bacterium JB022]|nr:methyltransferase domain-containing protein [Verrucomicrobiota bacterium JB022]